MLPRIVFMGTPDFAVASLKKLLEAGNNVVGIVTAPDKPAGRGRKIQASAVKQFAFKKSIPILQPILLRDEVFLSALSDLKPDIIVVVAFRMLPKTVWSLPPLGTFNLHASLLPKYRGAAPINWVLINGESKTGVSTFFINEEIDSGALLMQKETVITYEDNAGSLHDRLMEMGGELVCDTVEYIASGRAIAKPQSVIDEVPLAPKLNRDICRINWNMDKASLYNFIRGLSPYPAAWAKLHSEDNIVDVKIFHSRPHGSPSGLLPGTIIQTSKGWDVAVADGWLEILEAQLPGRRRMPMEVLSKGFTLEPASFFS